MSRRRAKKKRSAHQERDGSRNCSVECECGRPKDGKHEQCELCTELNGQRDTDKRVITAMRDFRVLSQAELCHQAEFSFPESLSRVLKRFIDAGRIKVRSEGGENGKTQLLYIWVGDRVTL